MLLTIVFVAFVGYAQAKVGGPCEANSECEANECCVDALIHIIFNGHPKDGACDAVRALREGQRCFPDRTYPKGVLPYQCNHKCGAGLECKNNQCTDPNKPVLKICFRQADCGYGECCMHDRRDPYARPACRKTVAPMLVKNAKCLPNIRSRTSQCPMECGYGLSCQKFDHGKFGIPTDMGHLFSNVYHCAEDARRTTAPTKPPTKPPMTTMDPGSGEEIDLQ